MQLHRRSFLARIAAEALLGGSALALLTTGDAMAVPSGGGCTDRDPTDGINNGRHCGRHRPPPRDRHCTDRDPTDRRGHGRHCHRR